MAAAALITCVFGVAACGGGSSSSSSTGSASSSGGPYAQGANARSTAPSGGSGAVTVKISKTSLGPILTDGKGRTLYLFEKDKGANSTCFGACAAGWPPLTAGSTPEAAGKVAMSRLSTISRGGTTRQVTYAGHPLYYFIGDKARGQTAGEGLNAFGAEWYALSASGKKVEGDGS
jgi:predicted lipoprotein with Yx(FWY)xxD motif